MGAPFTVHRVETDRSRSVAGVGGCVLPPVRIVAVGDLALNGSRRPSKSPDYGGQNRAQAPSASITKSASYCKPCPCSGPTPTRITLGPSDGVELTPQPEATHLALEIAAHAGRMSSIRIFCRFLQSTNRFRKDLASSIQCPPRQVQMRRRQYLSGVDLQILTVLSTLTPLWCFLEKS